jgi:hypothetical protein
MCGVHASLGGCTAPQQYRRQPHAHVGVVGIDSQGARIDRLGITVPSCEFICIPKIREQLNIVPNHGAASLQFSQRVVIVGGGTIGEPQAVLDERRIRSVAHTNRQCETEDRQDDDASGDPMNGRERPVQNAPIIARTAESV